MSLDPNENKARVKVFGTLNENACFPEIPGIDTLDSIEVDFNELRFMNSSGLVRWFQWIQEMTDFNPRVQFHFYGCPRIVVEQINLNRNFLPGGGVVHSIYVPYYSEQTDESKDLLIERGEHFIEKGADQEPFYKLPEMQDSTGISMEPDIIPEKYFGFLF